MADTGDARALWIERLAAAGPKASSEDDRRRFAEAVATQLAGAYERGVSAENARETHLRIEKALWRLGRALDELVHEIDQDPFAAEQCGLNAEKIALLGFTLGASIAKSKPMDPQWEADRFTPARPGRKSRAAVEIATMLAIEYDRHFGQPPGNSKQGDKNNPFFRVCKVVEAILEATDCKGISLGDEARREGIFRACTAAVKETKGMGPADTFVADDPRGFLLRLRNGKHS